MKRLAKTLLWNGIKLERTNAFSNTCWVGSDDRYNYFVYRSGSGFTAKIQDHSGKIIAQASNDDYRIAIEEALKDI
jgi:hypothetical protein